MVTACPVRVGQRTIVNRESHLVQYCHTVKTDLFQSPFFLSASRRDEHLAKAQQLALSGKRSSAFEIYAKCIDITPEMAFQLIKALKAEDVPYLVAPYEADAQLAYLERVGLIDAIVTEDSDLLVFGCNRVLFKMDSNGDCFEVNRARLTACRSISLAGWTSDLFRQMAILSGCDYLPSIPGMGLRNAHKLLARYKSVKKLLQAVRLEGKWRIPVGYSEQFEQAEKTFIFQRVWDPLNQQLTTLHPLTNDLDPDVMTYIGPLIDQAQAWGIATGDIDPISRQPMKDIAPNYQPSKGGAGSAYARSKSMTTQATKPAPKTKSKAGLDSFFKKTGVTSSVQTSRRPLAPKDTNRLHQSDTPHSTPVRSVYFGGSATGIKESPTTPSTSMLPATPPSTGSAMGDYYFELDGGDPSILMPEEDDIQRIPAFAEYVYREEQKPFQVAQLASFGPTQTGVERWTGPSGCDSEVSSNASDSPRRESKKRKYDASSLASDSDAEDPLPSRVSEAKGSPGLHFSSPGVDTTPQSATDKPELISPPSPSSPLQERNQNRLNTAVDMQAKEEDGHDGDEEDDIAQHSDEDRQRRPLPRRAPQSHGKLCITNSTKSSDLWSRFSHTPTSVPQRRPLTNSNSASSITASLQRTPSHRPLRLYASPSPCQSVAFAKKEMSKASLNGQTDRPKAGLALSTGDHDAISNASVTPNPAVSPLATVSRPRPRTSLSLNHVRPRPNEDAENQRDRVGSNKRRCVSSHDSRGGVTRGLELLRH